MASIQSVSWLIISLSPAKFLLQNLSIIPSRTNSLCHRVTLLACLYWTNMMDWIWVLQGYDFPDYNSMELYVKLTRWGKNPAFHTAHYPVIPYSVSFLSDDRQAVLTTAMIWLTTGSLSSVCHFLNFKNRTITGWDMAKNVPEGKVRPQIF